jgi:hypothetical protein
VGEGGTLRIGEEMITDRFVSSDLQSLDCNLKGVLVRSRISVPQKIALDVISDWMVSA